MNMKVHQTLVWLKLLSFGTKGLTAPTIGIQSGLSWVEREGGISHPRLSTWNSLVLYSYFVTNISGRGDLYVTNNTLLRHTRCPLSSCILMSQLFRRATTPPPPHTDLTLSLPVLARPPFRAVPARRAVNRSSCLLTNTTRACHPPPTRAGRGGGGKAQIRVIVQQICLIILFYWIN